MGLKDGKRGNELSQKWGKPFPLFLSPFFYLSILSSINPVLYDSCQMQMSRPDTVSPQGTLATC